MKSLIVKAKKLFSGAWMFRGAWYDTPVVYVPYLIFIALMVMLWISTPKSSHIGPAFNIGLNVGIILMTWLKRQDKKFDKQLEDLRKLDERVKRDIMAVEIEAKLREEYDRKYNV
jgi:hypothetical protein